MPKSPSCAELFDLKESDLSRIQTINTVCKVRFVCIKCFTVLLLTFLQFFLTADSRIAFIAKACSLL